MTPEDATFLIGMHTTSALIADGVNPARVVDLFQRRREMTEMELDSVDGDRQRAAAGRLSSAFMDFQGGLPGAVLRILAYSSEVGFTPDKHVVFVSNIATAVINRRTNGKPDNSAALAAQQAIQDIRRERGLSSGVMF